MSSADMDLSMDIESLFANFTDSGDSLSGATFDWTTSQVSAADWSNPQLPESRDIWTRTSQAPSRSTLPQTLSSMWQDEDISAADLDMLHRNYFNVIYHSFPFLNKARFEAQLAGEQVSHAALSLKNNLEWCERHPENGSLANLDAFQALLCILRYEATDLKLDRAWITLGRAVQLSKMLRLHQMDRGVLRDVLGQNLESDLPPTEDPVLLEERRRSFWALYILESYVRTRTGMKCELADSNAFEVCLPSPGILSNGIDGFQAVPMPLLCDITIDKCPKASSYAGCVLMVQLALRCFDHGRQIENKTENRHFWDNHYSLLKDLDERFAMLKLHLSAKSIQNDPVSFSLYMNLRATEIFFHQAAIVRVEQQGLPILTAAESQKRSQAAAHKIASAVRLNWPGQQAERGTFTLQATFIAWPLVMAMKALAHSLGGSSKGNSDQLSNSISSLRLLLAALDLIEDRDGYWHGCIASVVIGLAQWEESNGLHSLEL
ncbi:hypothetical protein JX265_012563 [Neoarthrinium moseri]|uniref:Xylanolytic transcriptional activator regulatory domain-containing protein n=1 Tax=Neoarthrinium moseri TaxID=1658444 RepID=A0A9P9W9V2_9PEZI|nr:hypothetical protein JX265_012563 [Neoarthrinium moseri]